METHHARYPFLSAARDAVGEAGVDLVDLVGSDDPAVDRGTERVERALVEGTIAPGPDSRPDTRTELLSYPIARVLVSLLDTPGAVEKYAAAEAATAHDRFTEQFGHNDRGDRRSRRDRSDDRSGSGSGTGAGTDAGRVTLESFLREFELGGEVRRRTVARASTGAAAGTPLEEPEYEVAVATYLQYAPAGPDWALVRRELDDGWVRVTRSAVYELLREAVERRVATGLPFEVPDAIAVPLADRVVDLRATLASVEYPRAIETVDPDAFPPCIDDLVSRARADDDLGPFERFALVTFCAYLGMTAEDVRDFCGRHGESFRYATERLAGDGGSYPPPSFTTLREQGVCTCDDGTHDDADHPLTYYVDRLDGTAEASEGAPDATDSAYGATDGAPDGAGSAPDTDDAATDETAPAPTDAPDESE